MLGKLNLDNLLRTGLISLFLVCYTLLSGEKLNLIKYYPSHPPKIHPYTQLLNKQPGKTLTKNKDNFNKILVILVDFPEEIPDDPNTTGNGKFQLEADPNYLYSIGSPPHNRQYFLDNLEALRYYYLAASAGSFNLEYEIYPYTGAYTLPHTMGYYNPPSVSSETFVSLMEEYFRDAFTTADRLSPEIDFSSYGHFMIIHAGSDWQHDILSDSPSDLPSFFISVGEGKEVPVDGGSVLISNACNVPSTISQDFIDEIYDGTIVHSGYGALNAVMAHEFGHSLGMVDLYNVYNWQPMVGVFDIMDSGGSGVLLDILEDGSYVMLEGGLPVLPGAWSRTIICEDFLKANGLLLDIDQIPLHTPISLSASSWKQSGTTFNPQILRIPLSSTEYILVENRNVDPDGDGATAVFANEDKSVILYPTAIEDPDNKPTYEYDYLLPSFQKADGSAMGGGFLVWHINNDVIYNQGVWDNEGNFFSNYENNSVNTIYSRRGVKIIEADNLPDIGYPYSWYWTGTQYEYFYAHKPLLDANGNFLYWTQEPWKPVLNSNTKPALIDSQNIGSLYWLNNMGNPSKDMSITVCAGDFDTTQIIDYSEPNIIVAPVINSSFCDFNIPVLMDDSVHLLSYSDSIWSDLMDSFPWNGYTQDFPITTSDQDGDGFKELILVHNNMLEFLQFSQDVLQSTSLNFSESITTAPISFYDTIYVTTQNTLSAVNNNQIINSIPLQNIKRLGSFENKLIAIGPDMIYFIDRINLTVSEEMELPESFGIYEPVSFCALTDNSSMLFLMSNKGNIYRYDNKGLQQIYFAKPDDHPTQLGLTSYHTDNTSICPVIFWGCGNKIYAINFDGSFLNGFPYDVYPFTFEPNAHLIAMQSGSTPILYLPVTDRGHLAFSPEQGILWQNSLLSNGETGDSHLTIIADDKLSSHLCWYYTDMSGKIFIQGKNALPDETQLYWNGFRNGENGILYGQFSILLPTPDFNAYVFPNPVKGDNFRIRIENFNQTVKLHLYNINADLLKSQTIPANGNPQRDIIIDSRNLSSGVYIIKVQCGNKNKTIKFAVQK